MSDVVGELSVRLHFDDTTLNSSMKSVENTSRQTAGKISSVFDAASKAIISQMATKVFDAVTGGLSKLGSSVINTGSHIINLAKLVLEITRV